MNEINDNSKYFIYGILSGFFIIIIVFLIASLFPFIVPSDSVAIIPIHGNISYDNNSGTCPSDFKLSLNKSLSDNNIKAIVLDIDSSGGNLLASQEILDCVSNSSKPIIAWISTGSTYGYLIASGADKIVANPNSIIGTYGFNYLNADLSDYYYKIGINSNTSEGNTFNTIYPNYNNLSTSQQNSVKSMLSIDLNYFTNTVKENRDINSSLTNFENGKIYNSDDALSNNLIDYIGDENKALSIAANMGNISQQYNVINFENNNNFLDRFMDLITKN